MMTNRIIYMIQNLLAPATTESVKFIRNTYNTHCQIINELHIFIMISLFRKLKKNNFLVKILFKELQKLIKNRYSYLQTKSQPHYTKFEICNTGKS